MKKIILILAFLLIPVVSNALEVEAKPGAYGCYSKDVLLMVNNLIIEGSTSAAVPYFDNKRCFWLKEKVKLPVVNTDAHMFGVSSAQFSVGGVTFWGIYQKFDFNKAVWEDW